MDGEQATECLYIYTERLNMGTKRKKSRISPPIPNQKIGTVYKDLKDGDCFLCDGRLWMKIDMGDQDAVDLNTGFIGACFCEYGTVMPVNINITWTKK